MKHLATHVHTIAIFGPRSPGAFLCCVPALRALRRAFPDAQVALLGTPAAETYVNRFPNYLDRYIFFPGDAPFTQKEHFQLAITFFMHRMQRERFDLILQMQEDGSVINPLLPQLNASFLAGFHTRDSYVAADGFLEFPGSGSEINRQLQLMHHLGIPGQGTHLEFPLTEKDVDELHKLLLPVAHKKYVCIHPAAPGYNAQWTPEYFALLADHCTEQGYMPVLIGMEDDCEVNNEVYNRQRYKAIDLTNKMSMGAMGALLKNALLLIAHPTFSTHIAAALHTPGIIISMDGEPERWGHPLHKVIDWTKTPQLEKVFLHTTGLLQEEKQNQLMEEPVSISY